MNADMNDFSMRNQIKWHSITSLLKLMLFAMVLTSIFSLLFTNSDVQQEALENETALAIYAKELYARTSLSYNEIASLCTNDMLRTRFWDDINAFNLHPHMVSTLESGGAVVLPYSFTENPITLLKIGEKYMEIFVRQTGSPLRTASMRITFTLMFTLGFLFLFSFYAGGRIVQPLTSLSTAMRQVKKGDFSVRLPGLPGGKDNELGQLITNFNQMVAELGSIEYLQKDFISNVSHEFKTPIASIAGFAKLLKSDALSPEEKAEYTDIIIAESQRLSHLSENLLRLSKLENQVRLKDVTPFSLDEQLRMAVLVLEPMWTKKDIEWDLNLDEVTCHGEADLLSQVWLNLLSNAIKFSNHGGAISVKLYQTDMIKVRIEDSGIGMTEAVCERIFDKFYQGDSSHSSEGNGLGLPLVKRIVELSGGDIHVKSVSGEGSIFTVTLPV
jgi:Signal transduction histidine kinase